MANKWTIPQEHAIFDNGGTLLVSAAAGSGKTSVLVERVIQKLISEENPVDADRLLIVTFSNAAAKEMKERIYKKLSELAQDKRYYHALSKQMFLLESANICTIHSFCIKLLRQYFEQLDLSPTFRIADEGEVTVLKSAAITKVLEKYYKQNDRDFLDLLELLGSFRDDSDLVKTIVSLHKSVKAYPFFEDWLFARLEHYEMSVNSPQTSVWASIVMSTAKEGLSHASQALGEALDKMLDDVLKEKYAPCFKKDLEAVNKALKFAEKGDLDGLYTTLHGHSFDSLPAVRGYSFSDIKDFVTSQRDFAKSIITDLKKTVCTDTATFRSDIISLLPKIKKLFELTIEFDKTLFEMKKERKILDFSDVEQLTLKLLIQTENGKYIPTELAVSLRENFDEILIDEYQDTNAAQDMIFRAISKNESNMFMVGDVKQSIYQFRQAMPKLFVEKQNTFHKFDGKNYPAVINLSENFRSRYEVTSAINFFFSLLMSEEFGQVSYDETQALKCAAEYPKLDGYTTEVDIVSLKDCELSSAQAQARVIAERIVNMMHTSQVNTKDGVRKPNFSDFCVLSRSPKNTAQEYIKVFSQFGIPAYFDTSEDCLTSPEIATLISLMRIVNNPTSDIDLINVLYSFIYAFSSDDIAQIRLVDHKNSLYKNMIELSVGDENINVKCREFLDDINDFRHKAAGVKISEFVEYVFLKTHYRELVMAKYNNEIKSANLDLFKDYCADFDTRSGACLDSFLRYLDKLLAQNGSLSGVNRVSGNSGVVRIMTIHHSKGLEFPFCFVTDLSKKFNKQDINSNCVLHSELGFACVRRDEEKHAQFSTIPLSAVKIMIDKTNLAEELRMLYVALTRAKEKLILVCAVENPDNIIKNIASSNPKFVMSPYILRKCSSFTRWILLALLRHPACEVLSGSENLRFKKPKFNADLTVNVVEPPLDAECFDRFEECDYSCDEDEELESYIKQSVSYVYPYEASTKISSKASVTDISKKEFALSLKEPTFEDVVLDGAKKGTAIHKFMQFCDYRLAKTCLKDEIERLKCNNKLSEVEADSIDLSKVANFFDSPIAEKIIESDMVKRELKFTLLLKANEIDPCASEQDEVIVQGIADCVYKDGDTIVVLDFKSDDVNDESILVERYNSQLLLYKKAIEGIFKGKKVKRVIYSFKLNKAIWLD